MPSKMLPLPPEIGDRVKAARESFGYNQKDFAELLAIGQSTLSRIENGERPPSPELLYRLALKFPSVDLRELLVGYPSCHICDNEPQLVINVLENDLATGQDIAAADYLAVPLVDGKIAAGLGSVVWEDVQSVVLACRAELGNKRHLVSVKVCGDSMSPTVPDGATVVIDRDDWRPSGNRRHIWAIRDQWGGAAIKRLFKVDDGLLVISDNFDQYPPQPAWTADLRKLVIGRVVWMCRKLE
ncbi:XRE family transcriptional regulator [Desulfarculus baarsii]|nr:XRE family transcriptional regulator [Desulfarculus baarsii]